MENKQATKAPEPIFRLHDDDEADRRYDAERKIERACLRFSAARDEGASDLMDYVFEILEAVDGARGLGTTMDSVRDLVEDSFAAHYEKNESKG